jgi:hypothetical protein
MDRGEGRKITRSGRGAWLVFLLVLMAVWTLGLTMKTHHFGASGFGAGHTFWMESAQRFRYIEMVAGGEALPDPDVRMQAPDGYSPWSDTVLQEQLYGRLHAALAPESDLAPFVRALTPLVSSLSVLAVALLVLALSRRRSAALLAAFLFAVAVPLAERGIGTSIFREDLAFPVLCLHLAALALWTRSLRIGAALASGLLLGIALLLWKVMTFYYLLLVLFFASAHWLEREQARRILPAASAVLLPAGAMALLPLSLRADSFLTSTPFLAGLAVLGMLGLEHFVRGRGRGQRRRGMVVLRPVIALALFAGLRWALPSERGYSHAWETIAAKLRFAGVKPADPTELSFHARHYWTGNYESPSFQSILEGWPWLILVALPGLWVLGRAWLGGPRTADLEPKEALAAGVDSQIVTLGSPLLPLSPIAAHFGLWMIGTFGLSFLAFRKLQLFFGLALVVVAGVGFAGVAMRRFRVKLLWAVPAALVFLQTPALQRTFCADSEGTCAALLRSGRALAAVAGPRPQSEWRSVDVFPAEAFDALARALTGVVGVDEPVLASFVVSPFILAHLDRPTVLHCFFEGDLLGRLEEVTRARFSTEEDLASVARRYGAKWYLHEAHHVLRTDPRMSQRYVAAKMDWPADAVITKMSYAPAELQHFALAWENDWFRLFAVLDLDEVDRGTEALEEGGAASVLPPSSAPLWSRALFSSLYGDPLGTLEPSAGESAGLYSVPQDLLYSTLLATRDLGLARRLATGGAEARSHARAFVTQALLTAPYLAEGEELLGELSAAEGLEAEAAVYRGRANRLRAALAGAIPLPRPLPPRPVLLDDGR